MGERGLKKREIPLSWYACNVAIYSVSSIIVNKVMLQQIKVTLVVRVKMPFAGVCISYWNATACHISLGLVDCSTITLSGPRKKVSVLLLMYQIRLIRLVDILFENVALWQ